MRYEVKHTLSMSNLDGYTYQFFNNVLNGLIYEMRNEIGRLFTEDEYHNLRIIMNTPLYHKFCTTCQMSCYDSDMYKRIPIIEDPTLYVGNTSCTIGIVKLVYEEPESYTDLIKQYCINDVKATHELFIGLGRGHGFQRIPHIDHVIFNGPATIVFWKDGTKTVVKHDGKSRKDKRLAVLYAFMRKIYGEGRPYHNILNEIEEAIK